MCYNAQVLIRNAYILLLMNCLQREQHSRTGCNTSLGWAAPEPMSNVCCSSLVPSLYRHTDHPLPALLQRDVRLLRKALKHSLAELATGDEERDRLRRRVEDLNKTLQVCSLFRCVAAGLSSAHSSSLSQPWRLQAQSALVL